MSLPSLEKYSDYVLKLVLIGDSNVGKTAAVRRYVDNVFVKTIVSTGLEFNVKMVHFDDKVVKLQIWDTAGMERYRCITNHFFRGTTGVMVFYDITNSNSFDHVSYWMDLIKTSSAPENVEVMLIGNKCDLEHRRMVAKDRGVALAMDWGVPFFENSNKTCFNVSDSFDAMVKGMLVTVAKGDPFTDMITMSKGISYSAPASSYCCSKS